MTDKELIELEQETLATLKAGNRKNLVEVCILMLTLIGAFWCVGYVTYTLSTVVDLYFKG